MLVFVNLGTKQGLKLIKKKKETSIIMETWLGKFRYEILSAKLSPTETSDYTAMAKTCLPGSIATL